MLLLYLIAGRFVNVLLTVKYFVVLDEQVRVLRNDIFKTSVQVVTNPL